ncbi:T9SS type A sorting domain-containing protein, partial [Flavobacterium psychrophilum]|uniref:T9SS type A sorting domain-containing protein n=1 Tax=Flavobacterium psychrophilum TaxID=96345 RepID=UPI00117B7CF5
LFSALVQVTDSHIYLNKPISEIDITIFDTFGKLIYQTKTDGKDLELSIPNLASGLYIVKLNSKEQTETLKFLEQ